MAYWNCLYSSQKLGLISGFPGRVPKQHLIEYNSYRPNITFSRILSSLQNLWGHINRASNTWLKHLWTKVIDVFGESKVSNFICSFIYENVCRFKISMYNFLSDKLTESIHYLVHNFEGLFLLKLFPFYQLF